MFTHDYYESVVFTHGINFNVSRHVNPSFINKLHWHPFVEILVSFTDHNVVSLNFTKYELSMNDILIIYPGDLHSVDACSEETMMVMQFSLEHLTIISDLARFMPLIARHPYLKYHAGTSESDSLVMLMKEICESSESSDPFREIRIYSTLLRFFEEAARRTFTAGGNVSGPRNVSDKSLNKITETCLYITQNFSRPLTLEEVSFLAGVSKSHFAHMFRKCTNMTFLDFLLQERIKKAKNMLMNSQKPITDIAFDAGFSSIPSFIRGFKKLTGTTPSEYRKQMLEERNA